MQILTWHQVLLACGSAETDSEWVQDELVAEWIGNRTFCVVAEHNAPFAGNPVDIVIIKEKHNDKS